MDNFELLKRYIGLLEKNCNAEIIINDTYGFFANTPLATIEQAGRWHLNGYCLKIKESPSLHRRCVDLKYRFVENVINGNGVVKSNCYCGVVEYAIPLFINGVNIAMISLTGFSGKVKTGMLKILSKRLGSSEKTLNDLRNTYLVKNEDEEAIIVGLEMLMRFLKGYIINETQICSLISESKKSCNKYVLKAIEYIEKNFNRKICVADVARECYISTPYLQNLFSSVIGHGVAEEISNRQIEYAKELLSTTEYSIYYIALECGFSSSDYFSTAFKRKSGIAPNKYRKSHRKLENYNYNLS